MLLEGDKGGQQLEGVAMKGTIAKRFEELDWDNNGVALQTLSSYLFCLLVCVLIGQQGILYGSTAWQGIQLAARGSGFCKVHSAHKTALLHPTITNHTRC